MAATLILPVDSTLTLADIKEFLRRCDIANIASDTPVRIGGLSPKVKVSDMHLAIPVHATRTILR